MYVYWGDKEEAIFLLIFPWNNRIEFTLNKKTTTNNLDFIPSTFQEGSKAFHCLSWQPQNHYQIMSPEFAIIVWVQHTITRIQCSGISHSQMTSFLLLFLLDVHFLLSYNLTLLLGLEGYIQNKLSWTRPNKTPVALGT